MAIETVAMGAVASITRRAADRLRAGHLWIYRSDVERIAADGQAEPPPGALVSVVDSRGIPLGSALYSAGSEIALRMVSRQAGRRSANSSGGRPTSESISRTRALIFSPGQPSSLGTSPTLRSTVQCGKSPAS